MEDNFKVRVDKVFGSLASSSASSPTPSLSPFSLWSLTDDEIERKEWNRDKSELEPEPESERDSHPSFFTNHQKGPEHYSIGFRDELEKDILEDLDDDEEEIPRSSKPDHYNDEEWEIKSCIGRDCTLDYEDEEDEYDKVAVGEEKGGDRLYVRDKADYVVDVDSCNVLPNSFEEVDRDPRANHLAAKIRLEEDAEAANQIGSLRVSEKIALDGECVQTNMSEGGGSLKSILKRKYIPLDSKSEKRVRFEPECKDNSDEGSQGAKNIPMETSSMENVAVSNKACFSTQDYTSAVPDYLRNPSRYTHYTFNSSSDMDEESNKQSYMDFLKLVKRSNTTESQPDDDSPDLPSVTFIPKRKTGDATMIESCDVSKQNQDDVSKKFMHRRGLRTVIAATDTDNSEVCAMEEDEAVVVDDGRNSSQRQDRKYRMRSSVDLE